MGRGGPHRIWAATRRCVRITRRYSVPPFKGVIAVKAREKVIAEIGVETFVIEVWIALSALRRRLLRRLKRSLANLAVVVDERIAGVTNLRPIEERKVYPSVRTRQSTFQ